MFGTPTPTETMYRTVLNEIDMAKATFLAKHGVEPNVILLSGFHMTIVVQYLNAEGVAQNGNVQKDTILGLPIIIADVTPSVALISGDPRFKTPRRSAKVVAEQQRQVRMMDCSQPYSNIWALDWKDENET